MNAEKSAIAKNAYDSGNYAAAIETYLAILRDDSDSLVPGDMGYIYHQMGNCLMKINRVDKAIPAYGKALDDSDYTRRAALLLNMGLAYASAGDLEAALDYYGQAVDDPGNDCVYKAYNAQGQALLKLGRTAEAGTAFRNAALDEANPDPSRSLVNLGVCFMGLGRPHDAVEAYRASLDFESSPSNRSKAYANMGQAYYATGRMPEAVASFQAALENGEYRLSPAAQSDFVNARAAINADSSLPRDTSTPASARVSSFGNTGSWDPVSQDTSYIPAADDTGFFSISEEKINEMGRDYAKKERKLRNIGLKIALAFAVLILIALGLEGFAYYKGYGYPLQEEVVSSMFDAYSNGQELSSYWAQADEQEIAELMADIVPAASKAEVLSVERGMTKSSAFVRATTPQGGQLKYIVSLGRDMLSWKITNVELVFASTQP